MEYGRIRDIYTLLEEREIPDLHSRGFRLRHRKTGARIMLLENDDKNKVFYVGFRTPPEDSCGTPHILEHSVLCGSRKFPVKDPFIELAKGSLNTFLNAMTYPDKTVYPVASTNDRDFKNLVDVYMDAVLHPNIYEKEEIFKQEGWHYEITEADEPLKYNGVVYNEMKGAYSSPDDVLSREINMSLFPDTQYGKESGGDPEFIPDLSYEKFKELHSKYYHPSNSYIYLYGDLDMAEMLEYLDREYLSEYEKENINSFLKLQKPFSEQRYVEKSYSITEDEETEENTYLSENFVVGTNLDPKLYVAFQILEYALLDVPGAPLMQALLDKGIGHDVEGSYDNGIYQPVFSVTVRNSDPEKKQEFLDTINEVLKEQVSKGLDKKALLAAINFFEFRYREADFGAYPKGLMYGLQSLDSWLYDEEKPFIHIESNKIYEELRNEVDSGYFEGLIKKYLLENSFSSVVVLKPERGLTARKDKKTADKLAKIKESLGKDEIEQLIKDTAALKAYQSEPSTEEELMTIPMLKVSDIDKKAEPIHNEVTEKDGTEYLFHEIFTNGISYLTLSFDLSKIPEDLLPYASVFKSLLCQVNTEKYSYTDLNNEINLNSGGIDFSIATVQDTKAPGEFRKFLDIRGRFLEDKTGFAFEIVPEILFNSDFEDRKRVKEVLSMMVSRMADKMISSGHATGALRAASCFSAVDNYMERISGISFYDFIKELNDDFDSRFEGLKLRLKEVKELILRQEKLLFDLTGSRKSLDLVMEKGEEFKKTLKDGKTADAGFAFTPVKKSEGIRTASQVQYVAEAGDARAAGLKYTGALRVLKVIMGYDYLWNNVRVKGGAYGCMSSFSRTGQCHLVSYRDPNLTETLDIFNNARDYISSFEVSERDMTKFIIGAVSALDTPLTPKSSGLRSRMAYYSHVSFDDIQRERDEVLGCDRDAVRELSPFLDCIRDSGYVCVLGSEEKIKDNAEIFTEIRTLN